MTVYNSVRSHRGEIACMYLPYFISFNVRVARKWPGGGIYSALAIKIRVTHASTCPSNERQELNAVGSDGMGKGMDR